MTTDGTLVEDQSATEGNEGATPSPAPTGDEGSGSPTPAPSSDENTPSWRDIMSGGDPDIAKELERYADPGAFHKSFKDTQTALNNPYRVKIPDEKSTDEERAAFARLQQIPESPDGYKIELSQELSDHEFSDADQEILADLTKELHADGGLLAHPKVVNAIHNAYAKISEDLSARNMATVQAKKEEGLSVLRSEWGSDFEANKSYASGAAERFGGKDFLQIQLADGSRIGDNPTVIKALAAIGRETMEDHVFLEAGKFGGDPRETLEAEKAKILELFKNGDLKAYDAKQARLNEINRALAS